MIRPLRSVLALVALSPLLLTGFTTTPSGRVVPAPAMHDKRADHTATLLRDGRVLIAGGMVENGVFLDSAELFDPATGAFTVTGPMNSRRVGHSATLLPNGKVLIAGGLAGRQREGGPGIVASTEIYDPQTGRFTAGPNMSTARDGQGAVLLSTGKVLLFGGADHDYRELATAEIYDPSTNRMTPTASMHLARTGRPALLLNDGRVLVSGGGDLRQAEAFDPKTSTWQVAGEMTSPRMKHSMALLPDGRVLVVGGAPDDQWHPVRSAEVFDPKTNRFAPVSDMELARFKIPDASVRLKNGNVLVAGGAAEVEVFDAASGRFARAGNVEGPHYFATATLLGDGRVLIAGGYGTGGGRSNGPLSTERAWVYQP